MSELLPCPFCGGEARTRTNASFDKNYKWTVQCKTNWCMGEMGCAFYRTEAEAIEAWNTRADDYKQAAEYWQRMYEESFTERTCRNTHFVTGTTTVTDTPQITYVPERTCTNKSEIGFTCSECNHPFPVFGDYNYCPNCGARVTPKNSETTPKVVS